METSSLCQLLLLGLVGFVNFASAQNSTDALPVIIWHGMGDTCCYPFSMGRIKRIIENEIPGIYVHSLMIGDNIVQDLENGFFLNANKQVEMVCEQLQNDTRLSDGYNALGFSQGGQFLRALAERCPQPRMNNLVTFGGQHQGVYGVPHCFGDKHMWCDYIRELINHGAYHKWIQDFLVQAEYWHDPLDEERYRNASVFLADINNDGEINEDYRTNLQQLSNFVMVMFNNDTMVEPVETEWFGFYTPGQAVNVASLQESPLYKEDWLGLKAMDEDGKLHFLLADGDHLQFEDQWFIDNIINKFFRP